MLAYIAGALVGAVGASYLGMKAFCPWLLSDLRYIKAVIPYVNKVEKLAKQKKIAMDIFEEHVESQGDAIFLIYQDKEYTYKEMNEEANRLARAAATMGLKQGDTVALIMYNEPAFIWTWFAMMKVGVTISLINTNLRGKQLQHCIQVSDVKAIFIGREKELVDAVAAILPELPGNPTVYLDEDRTSSLPHSFSLELHKLAPTMSPDNTDKSLRTGKDYTAANVYIFTSGTTGLPKAALLNQKKMLSGIVLGGIGKISANDRVMVTLPLYHSNAFVVGLTDTLILGGTVVLERKFSKSSFFNVCRKHKVTVITYIGELCRFLLTNEPSELDTQHSVRLAIGNGLRQDIFEEFQKRFNISMILEFYASTEGSAGMINFDGVIGACGKMSPFTKKFLPMGIFKWDVETESLMRDSKGHCIPVEKGQPGLLLTAINKRLQYEGYRGRKELSESKIVRNVLKDGDSFYNTGDTMVLDKNYYAYFTDRVGDTFRWKGENVSTTEVSNCLTELDFIFDASVYGVVIPGHDGKAGMACLQVTARFDDQSIEKFQEHCKTCLAVYARPMFLRIHGDDLDMTSTLKHNKVRLKKEGYDCNLVQEQLYYFDKKGDCYKKLTSAELDKINQGTISF